jgi:hypothetical protein
VKDIYEANLQNLKLTCLLSCNTSWGRTIYGEGLPSVARAIHIAGCPSVIAVTAKAPEGPTGQIFEALFKNLETGLPLDRALQEAKKTMKQQIPKNWASVICLGNGNVSFRPR